MSDLDRCTEICYAGLCAAVIFETVLAAVKEATGATNVYLGKKIQLPEAAPYVSGPRDPSITLQVPSVRPWGVLMIWRPLLQIKYVAGSAGNEWMVGKVLRGALPGAEEEGAGDEGNTHASGSLSCSMGFPVMLNGV